MSLQLLTLRTAHAEAVICPGMGGNCLSLRTEDADVLRTPAHADALVNAPTVYGMPLLFPPNRIAQGRYTFDGRVYDLPVNEPARSCHLHGTLCATPFEVTEVSEAHMRCRFHATHQHPYSTFPHPFTMERTWRLSGSTLTQRLTVRNDGASRMPVGVGFHTALNVCFLHADADPSRYRLRMSAEEEICCDPDTILPTGERQKSTPLLAMLNGEGVSPQGSPISRHMKRGEGGAELIHLPDGKRVSFTVSDTLPYWMLWNRDGASGFICPEPQSWIINSPNISQQQEKSGFRALDAGESVSYETKLEIK